MFIYDINAEALGDGEDNKGYYNPHRHAACRQKYILHDHSEYNYRLWVEVAQIFSLS